MGICIREGFGNILRILLEYLIPPFPECSEDWEIQMPCWKAMSLMEHEVLVWLQKATATNVLIAQQHTEIMDILQLLSSSGISFTCTWANRFSSKPVTNSCGMT